VRKDRFYEDFDLLRYVLAIVIDQAFVRFRHDALSRSFGKSITWRGASRIGRAHARKRGEAPGWPPAAAPADVAATAGAPALPWPALDDRARDRGGAADMDEREKASAGAPTLRISSVLHGERIWRRVGVRDHVTVDVRQIVLATWESACVVCGAPFRVEAPIDCSTKNRGFDGE
jgi:hypothetical protein